MRRTIRLSSLVFVPPPSDDRSPPWQTKSVVEACSGECTREHRISHIAATTDQIWMAQVFLVIFFWVWRIVRGNPGGPRVLWLRRANRSLGELSSL